jgi:hypothetical protein
VFLTVACGISAILGKDKKGAEEELRTMNLFMIEYGLSINMDKTVEIQIVMSLGTNVIINVSDRMIQNVNQFV